MSVTAAVCPVCQGQGTVEVGFYPAAPGPMDDNIWPINGRCLCRSCCGRGFVAVSTALGDHRHRAAGPLETKRTEEKCHAKP